MADVKPRTSRYNCRGATCSTPVGPTCVTRNEYTLNVYIHTFEYQIHSFNEINYKQITDTNKTHLAVERRRDQQRAAIVKRQRRQRVPMRAKVTQRAQSHHVKQLDCAGTCVVRLTFQLVFVHCCRWLRRCLSSV